MYGAGVHVRLPEASIHPLWTGGQEPLAVKTLPHCSLL